MSTTQVEVAAQPAATYYLHQLQARLLRGEYATEATVCFCGARDDHVITQRDRYGIPHRMVLCRRCALIRADPRMTADAYRAFYATEYRGIYGGAGDPPFFGGMGDDLNGFLRHWDVTPTVVADIGCGDGRLLASIDGTHATYGCDVDATVLPNADHFFCGGIETLEHRNIRPTLVLLHHALEHFLDLETELRRIHRLLADDGFLYIGLPGLFCRSLDGLWQNAHAWQFTAETLTYVLQCCGFTPYYVDEWICALFRKGTAQRSKDMVAPLDAQRAIQLRVTDPTRMPIPPISGCNKFSMRMRTEHVEHAHSLGLADFGVLAGTYAGRTGVIVSAGPSVDGFLDDIRRTTGTILCIDRMFPRLVSLGIVPDVCVVCDAEDDVGLAFDGELPEQTTFVVSNQVHPTVLKKLPKAQTYLYSMPHSGIDLNAVLHKYDQPHMTVLNGGGSVTLTAVATALVLGIRTLHIYGFDCQLRNGTVYAEGVVGTGAVSEAIDIEVDGKVYTTTTPYLSFAQQAVELLTVAQMSHQLDAVTIHGDSLVNVIAVKGFYGTQQ